MLWSFIIFWGIFKLYPVQLCFWLLSMSIKATFYTFFGIPIVIYAFFKSVYDFGPKQYRKRGLWEIITQPVPTKFDPYDAATTSKHGKFVMRGRSNAVCGTKRRANGLCEGSAYWLASSLQVVVGESLHVR